MPLWPSSKFLSELDLTILTYLYGTYIIYGPIPLRVMFISQVTYIIVQHVKQGKEKLNHVFTHLKISAAHSSGVRHMTKHLCFFLSSHSILPDIIK